MHKMKVTAAQTASKPLEGAPEEIVFFPEGLSVIHATKDGKPSKIEVNIPSEQGEAIAAKLNEDLAQRMAQNVRPWIDFEHKEGKSAGNPTGFRYEPGKGVVMAVDWSKSGREAIEGKDFSYFSPAWLDGENGVPKGLDMTGPLGGLVNEPAFRDIPRIAAKQARTPKDTQPPQTMSKKIFASLNIDDAHKDAEDKALAEIAKIQAAAAKAEDAKAKVEADLAKVTEERDELQGKVEAAEEKAKEERKQRAETLIQAARDKGALGKDDDELAEAFREKIEAGDTFAEKALAALRPEKGPDAPIVKAGQTKKTEEKDEDLSPREKVLAALTKEHEAELVK